MPGRRFNGLTALLLVGCASPAASPSGAFQKAAPTLGEAEGVSGAFVAALADPDPRAMTRGFFEAHWSSQVPMPPEDQVAERAQSSRQLLGPLAVRPATLTAHGASVLACAPRDGWITLDFFFEAAPPRKLLGMRARPTMTPPDATPCGPGRALETPADVVANLDAYMAARVERVPFSGVVLVGKDGTALFAKAYGLADRDTKAPNLVDTRFNIGSSSKMFTALAIEQLAGAGRLGLADPVQRYLPDFGPKELAPATVTHLLTHTSGLGDVFRPPFFDDRTRLREPGDYLRAFHAELLEFPPGARGRYSNLGYMALGGVVERVSGEGYDAYVREHVWGPAGMNDTSNTAYDAPMANRATGYTHRILDKGALEEERWTPETRPNDALNLIKGSPAACTLSTAPDLLRFAAALLAGKIVDASTLARMTHGDVPLEAPGGVLDGRYGHGFIEEHSGGVRHFGHGGGLPGANAYFEILPEQGYTIVVLANEDPPEATWIGDRILTWIVDMLGREHR